jgi:hypothetical protein
MSKAQLKKATITVLDGADKNKVITVLFNPTEYSLERANSYKATAVPGLGAPLLQFVKPETDPVARRLRDLSRLLEIDRDLHAPPPVRFSWGPLEFAAVIEKLGRKVTMFHPDGAPARVTLSVSFKEYRTLRQQLENPRRESADKTKRRVVVGREGLWSIAAREYDDAAEWPRIAEANDLDDPREIAPGDWLLLPPIENPDGTDNLR